MSLLCNSVFAGNWMQRFRKPWRRVCASEISTGILRYVGVLTVMRVVGVGVLPLVTRAVSLTQFSVASLVGVAVGWLLLVAELGCDRAVLRYAAEQTDPAQRCSLQGTAFWCRVVWSALIAYLGWWIASAWGVGHGWSPELLSAVAAAALYVPFHCVFNTLLCVLRAQGRHQEAARLLLVDGITRSVGTLVWVVLLEGGLVALVGASTVSVAVTASAFLVAYGQEVRGIFRWRHMPALLRYGLPLGAETGLRRGHQIDSWIIGRLSGITDVGVYRLATLPSRALGVVHSGVTLVVEPFIFAGGRQSLRRDLTMVARLHSAVMLMSAAATVTLGPEIIAFLAPPSYRAAVHWLPWLVFAAAVGASFRVSSIQAGVEKRTGIILRATAASLIWLVVAGPVVVVQLGAGWLPVVRFVGALIALLAYTHLAKPLARIGLPILQIAAASAVSAVIGAATLRLAPTPLIGIPVRLLGCFVVPTLFAWLLVRPVLKGARLTGA